jgi:ribosomal protein S6--L-glutamate ligase
LKLVVISRNPNLYSTRRLGKAGSELGHDVHVINPLRYYMTIASKRPTIHYRGEELKGIDSIIHRIGVSITFYGTAVVRQLKMMGVYSINESVAISRSRDKLRSLQLLARKGIGLPVTGFAHSTQCTNDLIQLAGGAPLVIKLLEGTQGIGVVLAKIRRLRRASLRPFGG